MGEAVVDQNQLDQIGLYVKNHIGQWIREQNIYPFPPENKGLDKEILERMITVEQQLKFQNEKLELMMQQSDRRFEEIQSNTNRQFEGVNQRFNRLYVFLTGIFITMLGGFIPLIIKSL